MRLFVVCLASCFVSCSSDAPPMISNPCAEEPASCFVQVCAGDGDCPAGTHCGTGGTCTAQCGLDGLSCPGSAICDSAGRCVVTSDASGPQDTVCASVSVTLTPNIPTVVLLIDRSSSMNSAISGSDATVRWSAVEQALVGDPDGIVRQLESSVVFGAAFYSAIRTPGGGPPVSEAPCPRVLDTTDTQLNNFTQINQLFADHSPAGGTPTEAAVRQVVAGFPPAVDGGRRILVLATDGDPDTCDIKDTSPTIQTGVEDAVGEAYDTDDIETYVLSVGDDVAGPHLQRIANEGVGDDRATGTATVYLATTAAALEQAFDDIVQGARDCDLDLNGELDVSRAGEGSVSLNGTELSFGSEWEAVDKDTIRLLGTTCDTFLETTNVSLAASFPCDTVIIIN